MNSVEVKNFVEVYINDKKEESFEPKIIIIEDGDNFLYENLFSKGNLAVIDAFEDENNLDNSINLIKKDFLYDNEENFIQLIRDNEEKIDFVIYSLDKLANEIYEEENRLLKELKKLKFNKMIVLKEAENFTIEELLYHNKYCKNQLKIQSFFLSKNIIINNRLINQYEDITNYIEGLLPKECKKKFALEQVVNKSLKEKYIYNELNLIYEELFINQQSEILYGLTINEIYSVVKAVKNEFFMINNISETDLDLEKIEAIEKSVIENVIKKAFSINNEDNEKIIKEIEKNVEIENDEIIKGFLAKDLEEKKILEEVFDLSDQTAIMDYGRTAIMDYTLSDLEGKLLDDFKEDFTTENVIEESNEKTAPHKRLSIINMNENRTFKEVTLSENYGIDENYDFQEEEFTTPLAEIEEIDDKLKEVIWGDELAFGDLDEFNLEDSGVSKKFKKVNMNGNK